MAQARRRLSPGKSEPSDARTRILDAAVDQLRRHGPAKTGVVDVARALGISHAAVYRYFASKDELFDAVAERWLTAVSLQLESIAARRSSAVKRLDAWLTELFAIKRRKVTDDRELFETYRAIAEAARDVVAAHVAELHRQASTIIADGIASKEFRVKNADEAAATVLDATARFLHPHLLLERPRDPEAERRIIRLVLAGLSAGDI
jgi:AcrR family transcriptional regulator